MKRLLLILPLLALMFIACKNDDDAENGNTEAQLVKTITITDGVNEYGSWNFEYDKKNRLVNVNFEDNIMATLSYTENDLISLNISGYGVFYFAKQENKITAIVVGTGAVRDTIVTELNSDSYPNYIMFNNDENYIYTFQYVDGNVASVSFPYDEKNYKYDNKKPPFYHCKTPKWAFIYCSCIDDIYPEFFLGIKNNLIEYSNRSHIQSKCTYEYDVNDFPTKMFDNGRLVVTFTYY